MPARPVQFAGARRGRSQSLDASVESAPQTPAPRCGGLPHACPSGNNPTGVGLRRPATHSGRFAPCAARLSVSRAAKKPASLPTQSRAWPGAWGASGCGRTCTGQRPVASVCHAPQAPQRKATTIKSQSHKRHSLRSPLRLRRCRAARPGRACVRAIVIAHQSRPSASLRPLRGCCAGLDRRAGMQP